MGWFKDALRGRGAVEGIPGRARVAPASTRRYSEDFDDGTRTGSFSADEHQWVETTLQSSSVSNDGDVVSEWQHLRLSMPSWIVSVLYHAGTNERLAKSLPATIELPVTLDPATRRIIDIDMDAAAVELHEYRAVAVEFFKRTDSYLAGPRNIASAPGDALAAGKDIASAWTSAIQDAAADVRNPETAAKCSWSTEDVQAMRRNAGILAVRYQQKPKERVKAHHRAVQMLTMQLESVRAGAMSQADFDVMVMREEVSTAISAGEALQFRGEVGLHLPPQGDHEHVD